MERAGAMVFVALRLAWMPALIKRKHNASTAMAPARFAQPAHSIVAWSMVRASFQISR